MIYHMQMFSSRAALCTFAGCCWRVNSRSIQQDITNYITHTQRAEREACACLGVHAICVYRHLLSWFAHQSTMRANVAVLAACLH